MSIESKKEIDNDTFRNLKISDFKPREITGIGRRYLDRLIAIEKELNDNGFEGGLPLYLALSNKGQRDLSKELNIERAAIRSICRHFNIQRPSKSEVMTEKLKERWQDPEYREKNLPSYSERFRKYHKDPDFENKRLKAVKEAHQKPEVKQRKSEYFKKMWQQPEFREKRIQENREIAKMRWNDPEWREKTSKAISEAAKGRKISEEQREKKSAGMKKNWEDPEYRKRQSEARKKVWENEEFREKYTEVLRQRLAKLREDPEVQAKIVDSRKKLWQDPEFRTRRTKEITEINQRSDVRAKKSETMKALYNEPDYKREHVEILLEVLKDEEVQKRRIAGMRARYSDPEFKERRAKETREVITRLNQNTNQLQKAAEGIRKLRSDPDSASRFHLPTIQGYRRDIGYYAQSAWEANVARVLKYSGREFYSKESFILNVSDQYRELFKYETTQDTVDFIVQDPRGNLVAYDLIAHPMEDPVGIAKAEMFKQQYPDIPLHIIDTKIYFKLKRMFENKVNSSSNLCGWETSKDNLSNNPEKYS